MMDPTIIARLLKTERQFLTVTERMIEVAAPDKRGTVLRFMSDLEQRIAQHRDDLHEDHLA